MWVEAQLFPARLSQSIQRLTCPSPCLWVGLRVGIYPQVSHEGGCQQHFCSKPSVSSRTQLSDLVCTACNPFFFQGDLALGFNNSWAGSPAPPLTPSQVLLFSIRWPTVARLALGGTTPLASSPPARLPAFFGLLGRASLITNTAWRSLSYLNREV